MYLTIFCEIWSKYETIGRISNDYLGATFQLHIRLLPQRGTTPSWMWMTLRYKAALVNPFTRSPFQKPTGDKKNL